VADSGGAVPRPVQGVLRRCFEEPASLRPHREGARGVGRGHPWVTRAAVPNRLRRCWIAYEVSQKLVSK
jgi:hypothetical protein